MTMRHAPKVRSTVAAFLLSLLVHLITVLIISVQTLPPPAPVIKRPAPSAPIPLLSEKELNKLRRLKTPKARKLEIEERERQANRRQQIVEIPPPPVEKVPTKSRFLAEFNNAVKREMVHRERRAPQPEMQKSSKRSLAGGKDKAGSRQGKRHATSKTRKPKRHTQRATSDRSVKRGEQREEVNRNKKRPKPSKAPLLKLGDGKFKHQVAKEKQRSESVYGIKSKSSSGRSVQRMTPTHYQSLLPTLGPRDLSRVDGSLDHIERVKRGNQTALNTREFKYAFFFNRVKREVSARWKPTQRLGQVDPRGQVFGVRDRKTILAVTLNPDGSIAKIDVTGPSGVPLLDREAVSAFLRAQPFHHPPQGLVEADGLIHFKFGFYLEIGSRSFRLFR